MSLPSKSPELVVVINDGKTCEELGQLLDLTNAEYIVLKRSRSTEVMNSYAKRYHDYTNGVVQLRKLLSQLQVEESLGSDLWKAKLAAVSRTVDAIENESEVLRQVLIHVPRAGKS